MLIEDAESAGAAMGGSSRRARSNMTSLMELNGISVGDNLENEMFILTSLRLMENVVDSLRLDVDYKMNDGWHDVTLYKERPVDVVFQGVLRGKESVSFKMKPAGDGFYELYSFTQNNAELNGSVVAEVGKLTTTPVGKLTLKDTKRAKKVPHDGEIMVTRVSKKNAAAAYRSKVSAAEYDKESTLIVMTCSDNNEQRAEDVLNEVFKAYKQDVVENKNRVAESTSKFVDERVALIGGELEEIENRLAEFKIKNKLIDFERDAQLFATENAAARTKAIEAETELSVAQLLRDHLLDKSNNGDLIPSLNISGASYGGLVVEYNKLMAERHMLVQNTTESAEAVINIDYQLQALRESIISSVNSHISTLELQVRQAREYEAKFEAKIGTVPETEKEAVNIERQQALKSALYNYLLNKREEVALQLAINEANVRMVEYPMGSNVPISPRRNMILLISLLMGVLIPAGCIWMRRQMDVTICGRRDVEDMTSIPVAGELPHWKDGSRGSLISECDNNAAIVEAFRVMRYSVKFIKPAAKVVVCTSSTPGQGKSFVTRNFAVAQAMAGKRVLLIDADIRKGTLTRYYGGEEGLTNYLADVDASADIMPYIVKDALVENVDFLPAGAVPPNPTELLMSERLEALVKEAKESYDFIIFDATPAFSVADAEVLSRIAEMLLFVVRVGVQDKAFLKDLERMHKSQRLKNLSVVINDADVKSKLHYGYGYGYGYGRRDSKSCRKFFGKKK
jgi:capsular exopolysaccharide synthesis family protein